MDNNQLTQQEQIVAMVLDQYSAKKAKGIISVEFENGAATVVHQQINALNEKVDPIKVSFSSSDLKRSRLHRRQQRDQIELQIINLEEQLARFDLATEEIYAALEADVLEAEQKHQPSDPKKTERPKLEA
ncbi:MAG: hypothetical protein JNL64_16280 [Blastocatellia bacterium]|nr:hypothetical protein [Blastocatellia bacterium]